MTVCSLLARSPYMFENLDVDQASVKKDIRRIFANIFSKDTLEVLKKGHCEGFSVLWLLSHMIDDNRDEGDVIERTDIKWFNEALKSIVSCRDVFQKTDQSIIRKKLEEFCNWLLFFQAPLVGHHHELEKTYEILKQGRVIKPFKNFDILLSLSLTELRESVKLLEENSLFDNRYITICLSNHIVGMIKQGNDRWVLYDSNDRIGERVISSIEEVFQKLADHYCRDNSIAVRICGYSFESKKLKPMELLDVRFDEMCLKNDKFFFKVLESLSLEDLKNLISSLLLSDAGRKVLKAETDNGLTFLHILAEFNSSYLKDLIPVLEETATGKELLKSKTDNGLTFLHILARYNPSYLKKLIPVLEGTATGKELLKSKADSGVTFLHILAQHNPSYLKDLILVLEETDTGKELLKSKADDGWT